MTASSEVPTGLALLREPFPAHQISKLPKPTSKDAKKGRCPECGGWHGLPAIHLDYVGHAALTDRLLDADPQWTWEPLAMGDGLPVMDPLGGMWIKLTICGVTRLGYGHAGDKTGGDAIKEVIGDALRNAAMRFGAALDLWHKGDLHVDDSDDKKPRTPKAPGSPESAVISGPSEAYKALSADWQAWVDDIATQAENTAATSIPEAIKIIDLALESEQLDDPGIKVAIWSKLSSRTRSAIKAHTQVKA